MGHGRARAANKAAMVPADYDATVAIPRLECFDLIASALPTPCDVALTSPSASSNSCTRRVGQLSIRLAAAL
jgi:hypothetical protein